MLRREWRLLRADKLLGALTLLFCALALYATFNGRSLRTQQKATITSVRGEESLRLDSLNRVMTQLERGDSVQVSPGSDPRSPAVAGRSVAARWMVLPPGPLSTLAVGQSDLYPYFVKVTTTSRLSAIMNEEIDNPVALLAGRLDLAFVLLVLFPLLVLALTYNVTSREREQGTLSLIASQPADVRRIMLAKIVVRAGAVVALALVISVFAAVAGDAPLASPAVLARLAWWCTIVLVYGAFWFAVALAVNALGKSSATNAVALLGVWFALVIVIPALVSNAVMLIYPVPPRLALITAARAVQDSMTAATPRRGDALADFLAEHPRYRGSSKADTTDPQVAGVANANAQEQQLRPLYDAFDAKLRTRQDAAERFRFLSPALATQSALLDAAGTSSRRWRRFEDTWITAHDAWRTFFNDRVFAGTTLTRADLSTVPVPQFVEESTSSLSLPVGLSVLAVLVPALLLGLWSAAALRSARNPFS